MKRSYIAGISALAVLGVIPFAAQMPGIANLQVNNLIAQNNQNKPQVQLTLSADKKLVQNNQTSWQALQGSVVVHPGDVIRYNLVGQNQGGRPAKNVVFTQPIPKGTVYVLNSATNNTTKVSFSIDGGKTFVANPTIQVKLANGKVETRPAPAEQYSFVRWDVKQAINPKSTVKVSYQVKVR
ncbi:MAG: DUF11 domain-containing protein [Cyanosarcina radialis HA8281-LM2]|nr:DUF11 domain-containing protein [Cyanosarcina radialis HA8281-LM2]